MAGQDELIYRVVYESDEASFKAVQTQLNALTQQTAQAVQKAQVEALKSGAGVQGLKEIEGIVKGAQAGTAGLVNLAKQIQATKEELSKLSAEAKKGNGLNDDQIKKQVELKTALSVLNGEYRRAERDLISLSSAGQEVANTYNELVKKNAALSAEIRNMPLADTTGKLKSLKDQYAKNNAELKAFDAEMGNHQRNVGDYKNQILEATKSLSIFGVNIADVSKQFQQGKNAASGSAGGINTMKSSFQGLNTVMKANAIMLAVTAVIALAKAFMAAEPIMDRIKSIVATLEGAFSGLIKSLTSGGNWFKNISEGVKAAQAINELSKANYTTETKLIESRATSMKQMAELTLLAKDESKTVAERLKAVVEFEKLNEALANQEEFLAAKRVQAAQQGVILNKGSRESLRELAEARAQLAQADTDATNRSKENQEKINALQRKQIENERAISNERINRARIAQSLLENEADLIKKDIFEQKNFYLDLYNTSQVLREAEAEERRKQVRDSVADSKVKAEQIKTIDAQFNADTLNAQKELVAKTKELDLQYDTFGKTTYQSSLATKQTANEIALQKILDSNVSFEQKALAVTQDYNRRKEADELKYQQARIDIATKYVDGSAQRKAEEERLLQEQLQKQLISYAQYQQAIKALDEQGAASRVEIAYMVSNSIAGIGAGLEALGLVSAKKAFMINKAAGIANATVAGYQATAQAFRDVPYPFNFPVSALVAASAFGNVAKIAATQFNSGGGNSNAGSIGSSVPSGGGMQAGLSINNVAANQIGSSVTPMTPSGSPTIIVNNTVDRAGIATLVREGNEEISARGLTVSSV
jgi:hypothetical protein